MGIAMNLVTKREGDGSSFPKEGDTVGIYYSGYVVNGGVQFVASEEGVTFQFVVGSDEVVRGLSDGVRRLSLGQDAVLSLSPELAFGSEGKGEVPGGADVEYRLELVTINGRKAPITLEELIKYEETCKAWAEGKMKEFDTNPEVAKKKAKKHEGRDGYRDFLDSEIAKKLQAYEGAKQYAELKASGGVMDKSEVMYETLRRVRIYMCPFAVCKHGMHDRGFVYFVAPSPMQELFFQGGFDQLGRRLDRSVFLEYMTLEGFDRLVTEMPEMEVIRPNLTTTVEEYDPVQHAVVLFLSGDGQCDVLKVPLVPEYAVCLNLADDYVDKEKIQLNID